MRHVLLIHHDGNAFANPSLKALIDLLLEKGYHCTIRHAATGAPAPAAPGVASLPYGWLLGKARKWACDRLRARWLVSAIVALESRLLYGKPVLTIAVDRAGLIEAAALKRQRGVPFVFVSFEILFAAETSQAFKRMEQDAGKACAFWIVQDEARAAEVARENALDPDRAFLLPLASDGRGQVPGERLRDGLGIPADRKVAIMIGSMAPWTMAVEVMRSVDAWPAEWVLIVHERYGNTLAELRRLGVDVSALTGRIHFSTEAPRAVDDMGSVLSGVSAGIAFYRPTHDSPYTGRNLEVIGKAAGKIATYLRYGVPVVTNEIGAYARDIRTHGFGAVAAHPGELGAALSSIGEDAARAAGDYFDRYLDFSLRRDALWSLLDGAIRPPEAAGTDTRA